MAIEWSQKLKNKKTIEIKKEKKSNIAYFVCLYIEKYFSNRNQIFSSKQYVYIYIIFVISNSVI